LPTVKGYRIPAEAADCFAEWQWLAPVTDRAGIYARLLQDKPKQEENMAVAVAHHKLKWPGVPASHTRLRVGLPDPDDGAA
jgi:hypothetical protein